MTSKIGSFVKRAGFDTDRLGFATRTACASCLALFIAWFIGLEHPQWSAMTVWAASQPVRGALVEKSAFRMIGTVIGSLFGVSLMVVSGGSVPILVVGIAVWMGSCALFGNILRGFVSYGTMLAGYSAAMVALIDTSHPENIWILGVDRMLTVALGILAALAVGWLFAKEGGVGAAKQHARQLTERILRDIAAHLHGAPLDREEKQTVLSEMAGLETAMDLHATGSLLARKTVSRTRLLLSAQVAAVLWLRAHAARKGSGPVEKRLQDAVGASIATADADVDLCDALRTAARFAEGHKGLPEVLNELASAHENFVLEAQTPLVSMPLHRDWVGAREAAIRATVTMLAVGGVWLLTGWKMGGFMMLGAAIMISIFSTFERPVTTLKAVTVGQVLGVIGALCCRWLLWPFASNTMDMVFAIMPFVLVGGLLASHRRTIPFAFDYNMVLLLLLQPIWPLIMSFQTSLIGGAAVVAGPIIGITAFYLIFRTDSHRRRDTIRSAMVGDLQKLAADRDTLQTRREWRLKLYHRVLLTIFWAERSSHLAEEAADDGLAVLTIGSAIQHLHEIAGHQPGRFKRRTDAALKRLSRIGSDPREAARALRLISTSTARWPDADSELLLNASQYLSSSHVYDRRIRPET